MVVYLSSKYDVELRIAVALEMVRGETFHLEQLVFALGTGGYTSKAESEHRQHNPADHPEISS